MATKATKALRISENVKGDYVPLGVVTFMGGKLVTKPDPNQAHALTSFLAILRTQGAGPSMSDQEFFDTLPDRVNLYMGMVEEI